MLGIREMALRHGSWKKDATSANVPAKLTQHFQEFASFGLVTSQVPSRQRILTGHGPLKREGCGCCYNPRSGQINFVVSSLNGI